VWALPTPGGPEDFPRLVEWLAAGDDPARDSASRAVCALWAIRWKAGELLGWDGPDAGLGSRVPTLRARLPADLRAAPPGPDFRALPFAPLYLLHDEWAAEIANRTMHGGHACRLGPGRGRRLPRPAITIYQFQLMLSQPLAAAVSVLLRPFHQPTGVDPKSGRILDLLCICVPSEATGMWRQANRAGIHYPVRGDLDGATGDTLVAVEL
jgi:hypothetical protein